MTKREKIEGIIAFQQTYEWAEVIRPEIERLRDEADKQASDLSQTNAIRDGATGAKNALNKILAFPGEYQRATESALRKEKKASSPKAASNPLR